MHILSVPRLKRLIQCLFLILIGLFIGLISVLHQTVIFRSPSTAFVSSYNIGRVRTKTSSSLKSQNLIQGSILQTYYNKIFVSKCENLSPTEFPEPNQSKFWISIDDGFESHVRPTSYFDVRRVQNDVEYRSVKILASSQRRNLTDAIFCSIPKSETEILSVPATASEIWFSKWNANATNGSYNFIIKASSDYPCCKSAATCHRQLCVANSWFFHLLHFTVFKHEIATSLIEPLFRILM